MQQQHAKGDKSSENHLALTETATHQRQQKQQESTCNNQLAVTKSATH